MGCSSPKAAKPAVVQAPRVNIDFAEDFFNHYLLDEKLGQGKFAQVRSLVCRPYALNPVGEGSTLAQEQCAKIIDLRDKRQPGHVFPGLQDLAAMEAHILKNVGHHPNIIEFHGAYICEDICFLVMEKCKCSLYHHMKSMPALNERSMGKLMLQMVSALHHLHSARIVHRDVKPDNFLIGGLFNNKVKLCDFGIAAMLPDHGKLCGPVTTTPFTCPEMLVGEWYDGRADIWSLGVTVYVFFFGTFPYEAKDGTVKGMVNAIIQGAPLKFDSAQKTSANSVSASACNFVRALLRRNQEHRPSAQDALNLPFMAAVSGRSMKGSSLPSLQPMLKSARKAGAIACPDLSRTSGLDDFLNTVQFTKSGVKMLDVQTSSDIAKEERFHEASFGTQVSPDLSTSTASTSTGSGSTEHSYISL